MLNKTTYITIPSGEDSLPDIEIFCEVFINADHIDQQLSVMELIQLSDKPNLIFLHGGPGISDHNIYISFFSQFADFVNVIMFDMRGHGQSGGGELLYQSTWNLNQWADDIVSICDQFNLSKPIIAGVSFGTWVAYNYLIRHPYHASKLLLLNGEAHVDVELRAEKYKQKAILKSQQQSEQERIHEGEKVKQIILDLKTLALNPNAKVPSENEHNLSTADLYMKHCLPLFADNHYSTEELALCKNKNIPLWQHFDFHEYYKFDFTYQLKELKLNFDKLEKSSQQTIPEIYMIAGEYDPEHPFECAVQAAMILDHYANAIVIADTGDPVYRDKPDEVYHLLKNIIENTSE